MTTYARLETKAAELASPFGRDLATRWFGAEVVASLATYTRGAKAGQPKGWLVWEKAVVGGWDKGAGAVRPNDIIRIRIGTDRWSHPHSDAVLWYKANRREEGGPCNAARAGGYGKQVMERRSFAAKVENLMGLAEESPGVVEAAAARGDAAAFEALRRAGLICPECGLGDIESNGERGHGRTYRCTSCHHQWMPAGMAA